MRLSFTEDGWAHFAEWFPNQRIMRKINSLIADILRNGPLHGTGKPERLKYMGENIYSRRIDEANRLVYEYDENSGLLTIVACKGHYEN